MFKNFFGGGKKEEEKKPVQQQVQQPLGQDQVRKEQILFGLKKSIQQKEKQIDEYSAKIIKTEKEMRDLINLKKQQQAKAKFIEIKTYQQKIEVLENKKQAENRIFLDLEVEANEDIDVIKGARDLMQQNLKNMELNAEIMEDISDMMKEQNEHNRVYEQMNELNKPEGIDDEFLEFQKQMEQENLDQAMFNVPSSVDKINQPVINQQQQQPIYQQQQPQKSNVSKAMLDMME